MGMALFFRSGSFRRCACVAIVWVVWQICVWPTGTLQGVEPDKGRVIPGGGSATPPSGHGGVMYHGIRADKVLFLGNSITLHGPAPAIGWSGNWGMAASAEEKDYVHLVLKAIAKAAGQDPKSTVVNIADFERQFETYDVAVRLKRELAFRADLVIVAIGENVPALTSENAQKAFQASVVRLLKKFQENGHPVIVVRSCFWPEPTKDVRLQAACRAVGGIFVDAGPLGKDPANQARAERKFSHDGVAGHPGDKGMRALADAILNALRQQNISPTTPTPKSPTSSFQGREPETILGASGRKIPQGER